MTAESAPLVIVLYLAAISLIAFALTVYDKRAAQRGQWRIPERTLLLVAVLGGSAVMLATMRAIRHKTKHVKFMVGIPVIIALQIGTVLLIAWLLDSGRL